MPINDIKLNLINKSNDVNNSSIVIFQQNVVTNFDELAVAWMVIQNMGHEDHHPFLYTHDYDVSAEDSYGNITPRLSAANGDAFEMIRDNSGDVLQVKSDSTCAPEQIEIANNLALGDIKTNVYRSGKLLASKTNVSPAEKAVFEFKPSIFLGVASQIQEGDVMNSAIISSINTELSLLGISSADIVMTGGGSGANATSFNFSMENIVRSV